MRFRNRGSAGEDPDSSELTQPRPDVTETPTPTSTPAAAPATHGSHSRARGLEDAFDQDVLTSRDLRRRLKGWRQGDLLEGVPIAWVAPVGNDELTGTVATELVPGRLPIVTWDEVGDELGDSPSQLGTEAAGQDAGSVERGWAIITSQTCDIDGAGPGARHHTVQVCPVVLGTDRLSEQRMVNAKNGAIVELVHIPELPEDGDWFADLRLSVPVSKAVLAATTPRRGFKNECQAVAFAEAVARKSRRPAVHDAVSGELVPELIKLVKDALADGAVWPDAIEQIRIEVLDGDRLWPSKARLVVIGFESLEAEERTPLRNWQKMRARSLRRSTKDTEFLPGGIQLMGCRFTDLASISVTDYRSTVPLGIDGLSGGAFW